MTKFITIKFSNGTERTVEAADYHWKITRDFDYDARNRKGQLLQDEKSDVGREGPFNCDVDMPMPYRFRMYDDDGELYYEGRCSEEEFYPLDDFGTPNAGCTTIKYFNKKTGKLEVL